MALRPIYFYIFGIVFRIVSDILRPLIVTLGSQLGWGTILVKLILLDKHMLLVKPR